MSAARPSVPTRMIDGAAQADIAVIAGRMARAGEDRLIAGGERLRDGAGRGALERERQSWCPFRASSGLLPRTKTSSLFAPSCQREHGYRAANGVIAYVIVVA